MRLLVTGAGGYLGQAVARQARALPGLTHLRLTDRETPPAPGAAREPRAEPAPVSGAVPADAPASPPGSLAESPPESLTVETLAGDLCDPAHRARALEGVDAVIHLAAILGGAAERAPEAARRVNLDATLDLLAALPPATRFVFASSVAVLGPDLPDPTTDAAPVAPQMVYGAHKAMAEIALSTAARRGELDAVALRPAGIVARDGVDAALKSAFLSRIFHAVRRGEDIALPVSPAATTWLASARVTAANFLHAATMPSLPPQRALTLPALAPRMDALADALRRAFPGSPSRIAWAPDPAIEAAFGRMPPLCALAAEAAGFRRDADLDALVRAAFD